MKKVFCGFGIDVDAVSGWINAPNPGSSADPTDVSRGIFGATVGLDRVLKLLETHNIKATFFTPGHTLESFPEQLAKVRDAGHEIAMHGYTHEYVSNLSEEQERDVLANCIEVNTKFTGRKPRGWAAPAWTTSRRTVQLLEEFGVLYDHTFMHHDCQPYYLPYPNMWIETNLSLNAQDWMKPMTSLESSRVIEIPANWHLDDWPPLNIGMGGQGFVETEAVLRLWKAQFDFYYREYDTFVFPMTIHPQVSGKAHVQLMHEEMIRYINSHDGIQWVKLEEMASLFERGAIEGVSVKGGA